MYFVLRIIEWLALAAQAQLWEPRAFHTELLRDGAPCNSRFVLLS